MNDAKRMKELRKKLKLTQQELADAIGVKWHKIKDIEIGKSKIGVDIADKIREKFSISFDWLLTGKGSMFAKETPQPAQDTIEIPYYPDIYAAAGAGGEALATPAKLLHFSKSTLQELLDIPITHTLHIINAVGDSMEPTIHSGDKLFVLPFESDNHQIKEGAIYIIATPQGTLVKRLYPNPFANTITLRSDNPAISDITIQGDELNSTHIVGRVVGILRHT